MEADQAAKLAHIDVLKRDVTALKSALQEQQDLTQAAESALDAAQAEMNHHELVIEGQLVVCRLTFCECSDVMCPIYQLVWMTVCTFSMRLFTYVHHAHVHDDKYTLRKTKLSAAWHTGIAFVAVAAVITVKGLWSRHIANWLSCFMCRVTQDASSILFCFGTESQSA